MESSDNELNSSFLRLLLESDEDTQQDNSEESEEEIRSINDESEEEELESDTDSVESWKSESQIHDPWNFQGKHEIDASVLVCRTPSEFYKLFLNGDILALIVEETNRYGRTKCNS